MSRMIGLRTLKVWLAAASVAALVSCASLGGGAGPSETAAKWPTQADVVATQTAFTQEGLAALDARLKEAVDKGQVAGVEYVLIKDKQVAAFKIHGNQAVGGPPLTEETLFRIRSMTKPITGVAMMQLYEKGLWKPEDPVTKYVPEFANLKVYKGDDPDTKQPILVNASRPATMREVFTHTAGYGYGLSANNYVDRLYQEDSPMGAKDMNAMIARVAAIPLLAEPGERFSYSIGIDVQGAIVERLSGMTFGEYLEKNIFAPLAMKDTGFWLEEADKPRFATVYQRNNTTGTLDVFPDPANRSFFVRDHEESGGGGLVSTTHDYARFVQMLVNGGELDGKRILKQETVDLMFQNHLAPGLRGMGGGGWGYGGAVTIADASERQPQPKGSFSWFGIDGTWFWVDPVNDMGFVGMIQRRGSGGPGGVDLRGESAQLVYKALAPVPVAAK
jgi:CubicO group peptidase (beta-lactamase class C family)